MMDAYTIGKLIGFLRGLELPDWVEEIVSEIEDGNAPALKKKPRKKSVPASNDDANDANEDPADTEDETVEQDEEENDAAQDKSPYEKACDMFDDEVPVSRISTLLSLSVPTIYNYKNKYEASKKATAGNSGNF